MHEYMELTFLGTGSAWPSAQRNVSALALKRGAEILLFDCGEGTQRQFQRSDVSYMATSKIFFTHLHGDHILGLPGLMQTMDLNERDEPLEIYGPPGTKRYVSLMLSHPLPNISYSIDVTELSDGDVVEFDEYRVEARELDHSVPNLGYAIVEDSRPGRFDKEKALDLGVPEGPKFSDLQNGESVEAEDGSIVQPEQVLGQARRGRKVTYTGDCRPCEATVELAWKSDVLVHEATFETETERAAEVGHSTAQQAAFIADKADVRKLYMTHFSPRYHDLEAFEDQARKVFENAHIAEDLGQVVVKFPPDEPPEVLEGP